MIMIHQPVSPYLSAEGWVDYHAAIAGSVPDLGVVLYIRDPKIAGRHIRELGRRSPNVVGVKYGVKDMVQFAGVARDAGLARFTWLAGLAELTAPAAGRTAPGLHLRAGQRGPATVARPAGARCSSGDHAGALRVWAECRAFEELRAAESSADNVSVVKEALAQLGWPAGTSGRPAACCPTRCARKSARSWPAGACRPRDGQR